MKKTNFDDYLENQLQDPDFAACFKSAGEIWEATLFSFNGAVDEDSEPPVQ